VPGDDFAITLAATTLAPGASTTGTATRTLTQTQVDAGSVHDIALATGTPPAGANVTASDDATVTIPANPHIAVDKTAGSIVDTDVPANGAGDVGDQVTYTYVVSNTGNVTLSNITVNDDNGTPANPNDDFPITLAATTLAPGASTPHRTRDLDPGRCRSAHTTPPPPWHAAGSRCHGQ
jgi:hypothetical protein